jgi:hypothetical protein
LQGFTTKVSQTLFFNHSKPGNQTVPECTAERQLKTLLLIVAVAYNGARKHAAVFGTQDLNCLN